MKTPLLALIPVFVLPLAAETVILSTIPDENRALQPLTTLAGIPLPPGGQVRLGGFPGIGNAELLDAAAAGDVMDSFIQFGQAATVGQGAEGEAGGFEVAFRDANAEALAGTEIAIVIEHGEDELLVARFPGQAFSTSSDTALEPLRTLHVAEAALIVGNRTGLARFSTSPPPVAGSYDAWIAAFPSIADPAQRLPFADADGDGRSNFLEYATGGDPTNPNDPPACEILPDGAGGFWVRFRRVPGLGPVRHTPWSAPDLSGSWTDESPRVAPDPDDPAILRLHLAAPHPPTGFFKLEVE